MMGMKVLLSACMVVLVMAVSPPTAMSAPPYTEFYISVTGANQGPFKGELPAKGLEGKFLGRSFDYDVVIPRDTATGLSTGKAMHKPIRIQKAWGPASLQFYAASLKGELLTVTIDFWMPNQSGVMALDYTVKLTGAVVTSFSSHSENIQPSLMILTNTIELVFQRAEIVDHKTKAMVSSN